MQYTQQIGIKNVDVEDIYIGNGVSELVVMAMQGLINNDDEVLIPAPDFPLWSAAVKLCGGKPVHYLRDENSDWEPDLNDIRQKITPKTKAIFVESLANPGGVVTDLEAVAKIAEKANVALTTVKSHVSNIFRKLEVKNRTSLIRKAKELHLLE